jgi:hypothetical protein
MAVVPARAPKPVAYLHYNRNVWYPPAAKHDKRATLKLIKRKGLQE